jgi:hypothetical protein
LVAEECDSVDDVEHEEVVACLSMEADGDVIDANEGAEKGPLDAASPFLEVGADVVIASVVWEVVSARCEEVCFQPC